MLPIITHSSRHHSVALLLAESRVGSRLHIKIITITTTFFAITTSTTTISALYLGHLRRSSFHISRSLCNQQHQHQQQLKQKEQQPITRAEQAVTISTLLNPSFPPSRTSPGSSWSDPIPCDFPLPPSSSFTPQTKQHSNHHHQYYYYSYYPERCLFMKVSAVIRALITTFAESGTNASSASTTTCAPRATTRAR